MSHAAPKLPSPNHAAPETCFGLGHYPSGGHFPLGAFHSRLPLTAKPGPGSNPIRVGRDHQKGKLWDTPAEFLGDLIGAAAVFAIPFSLLFLEFFK